MSTPLEIDTPHCLYLATARAPVGTPPLHADARTEVAIVGAGYTGLSTALHLAERGVSVLLLEAHEPGWGAAGRNGGQVNPGLKHDPDKVEQQLGPVYGPRLVSFAGNAPAHLFALIARLGIDCEARCKGTIRAARSPKHVAALHASVEQWRRRGTSLETWDADQVAAATGTRRYRAASFDPRGGSVNPLSLARGLTAAAITAGAIIHGNTRALRLERAGSGWRIDTCGGTVHAEKVVLATDGYSDGLWPGLRTSIVPLYSSIIASEPLPAALAASILPGGGVVYESAEITTYYRLDRDGRLLMGGRGVQRRATRRADYEHLVRFASKLWPALDRINWTHWWNGQFALTPDYYPRLHAPEQNLLIALGYSGRGVALATALGAQLAAACSGTAAEMLPLPVTRMPQVPFHRLWRMAVRLRVAYGTLLDTLGGSD
ncbi:MAG TPA: FAD-binding oxidoreductase [Steroidobacteraceae bacterium]|nr:FAD-binding oxidoreductase [Steroidobacteraceae bacterium]